MWLSECKNFCPINKSIKSDILPKSCYVSIYYSCYEFFLNYLNVAKILTKVFTEVLQKVEDFF